MCIAEAGWLTPKRLEQNGSRGLTTVNPQMNPKVGLIPNFALHSWIPWHSAETRQILLRPKRSRSEAFRADGR